MGEDCTKRIQVGQPAPAFSGKAVVGEEIVDLSYEGGTLTVGGKVSRDKYLVFFFYPLDFTFVCPTEIIAFSDRIEEFRKLGAEVVGASIDSQFAHLAWKKTPRKQGGLGEINYPLFADLNRQAACDYGVLLPDGVAARGIFIIDNKGILQSYTVNNLPVGRSVDEALRLLQAYQFFAEHGEVCPANWTPGADTMKPDPVGAQSYFSKAG